MVAKIKEDLTDNDIKDLNISNLNSSIAAQNTCDERYECPTKQNVDLERRFRM